MVRGAGGLKKPFPTTSGPHGKDWSELLASCSTGRTHPLQFGAKASLVGPVADSCSCMVVRGWGGPQVRDGERGGAACGVPLSVPCGSVKLRRTCSPAVIVSSRALRGTRVGFGCMFPCAARALCAVILLSTPVNLTTRMTSRTQCGRHYRPVRHDDIRGICLRKPMVRTRFPECSCAIC